MIRNVSGLRSFRQFSTALLLPNTGLAFSTSLIAAVIDVFSSASLPLGCSHRARKLVVREKRIRFPIFIATVGNRLR
jgi:hypothetical protein